MREILPEPSDEGLSRAPFNSGTKRTTDGAPNQRALQREIILQLLREAGPQGVSKAVLIFDKHYTQAAARVWELEQQGYEIRHESREGERYVRFVLVNEPTEPHPRPLPVQAYLPLFDGLEA